jgi:hypothetical protein
LECKEKNTVVKINRLNNNISIVIMLLQKELNSVSRLSFGVAMPSSEWLGSRTEEGRAKLR